MPDDGIRTFILAAILLAVIITTLFLWAGPPS